MSIGPKIKENQGFKAGIVDKTRYATKETLKTFFEHPVHYLFYGTLSLTIIGLLLGRHFGWQLYLILALLGGFKFFINNQTKNG